MSPISTDHSIDSLSLLSVGIAKDLMDRADELRDRNEKANRKRVERLLKDQNAIDATITLTDEVMRINSVNSAVQIFRQAAKKASVTGFGRINAMGLHGLSALSDLAPKFVISAVHNRVQALSKDLILPAESKVLKTHLSHRKSQGIALNINVLGEAVLGDREAKERFDRIMEMIERPEVNYISVKLSAIVSQINIIDFEGSICRTAEKMRALYREANLHNTFINLDMEEYRDLRMTVAAFKKVLSEPDFVSMSSGIVLQAYLPESHAAFEELVEWSQSRYASSGGQIKIRLVKGANLAMEHAEAQLHGWTAAPYPSKADVDASYSRLIDLALRPEYANAVRIGIASHNLFHLTWAVEVAKSRGVLDQLDIEMLEGMANAEALAVTNSGQPVLLYAPVTKQDDFASAVAYLVRRLDENTSDENYLKAAFEISTNPKKFEEQKQRFLASIQARHSISTRSRRQVPPHEISAHTFQNQPNQDPTNSAIVNEVVEQLQLIQEISDWQIPLMVAGNEIESAETVVGTDPNNNGTPWYSYGVGNRALVDAAIVAAKQALGGWSALSVEERREILFRAATMMDQQSARTLAVMARDTGKTISEGESEVSEGIDFARFYALAAQEFGDSSSLGTVLVVPPWNFPYAIPAGGVCAALAAGNTVILKPAPEAVAVAWELVQHLWSGGVPKDVLQFLPMRDDEAGKYLVTHPLIDGVILTGSFETAAMFISWRPEINLMAETSGKNSMLISACADIDSAVKDLVQSAFGHAGQKCSAASVAIVDQTIYDDPAFIRQLRDAVETLKVGPAYELATTVGPIIRPADPALQRALTTLDPGERWLVQPEQLDQAGLQWRPGVKLGVRAGSWSHTNEWFGPVLAVIPAPDFQTAMKWQNETEFALTAGIHSLDEVECEFWIDNVAAGNVYVNRGITGAVVNRQPFGGWKRSSVGPNAKAGGLNYLHTLRLWPTISNLDDAMIAAELWWSTIGSNAIDRSGLTVEMNFQRYRHYLKPILVRVDSNSFANDRAMIESLRTLMGVVIEVSEAEQESVAQFLAQAVDFGRVRWLTTEPAPVNELLQRGISVDRRPIAQRGDIEAARWLLEQSVAITYHRYGNTNGGPKPACRGLGD